MLLRIDQPQFNHDGGGVNYGPDGLYIALGDGGTADDQAPGHNVADGNAQDTSNVLGTILRIDPQGDNSANREMASLPTTPSLAEPAVMPAVAATRSMLMDSATRSGSPSTRIPMISTSAIPQESISHDRRSRSGQ